MHARRWVLALVITLMLVDALMPESVAAARARPEGGPGARALPSP